MKYLAITISGAVSLGAYEAGVLYEVLRAIKAHNADPATTPEDTIVIDVITGASAGGMSATILAQKLLLDAAALEGYETNALFQAWVKQVDLAGLLILKPDEAAKMSLLSSDLVETISRKWLTDRYQVGVAPSPANRHPGVGNKLVLGLALSNLNGVDYGINTVSGRPFVYTQFQDECVAILDAGYPSLDTLGTWEPLRNAAVACGAFPFAFRDKELHRALTDYRDPINFPDVPDFAYTDGGVFHNEPLGMAKNLVDLVDPDHLSHASRFYLFVAPQMRSSARDGTFTADTATLVDTGKELVKVIFNQARFKDWVQVEKVNDHLARFESQVAWLRVSLADGSLAPKSLEDATAALLPRVYPDLGVRTTVLDRLRDQYASDLATLADPAAQDVWLRSVAVLEKVAGVASHDPMVVYTITATDKELAGSCLYAFGGFFDERYRRHDYELGREKAQTFLAGLAGSGLGPIRYTSNEPAPQVDPALADVQVADLDEDKRKEFRGQILDRIDQILSDFGVALPVRKPIEWFWLKPKLNKWLGL